MLQYKNFHDINLLLLLYFVSLLFSEHLGNYDYEWI